MSAAEIIGWAIVAAVVLLIIALSYASLEHDPMDEAHGDASLLDRRPK